MPRVSRGPRLFQRNGVFYILAFNGRGRSERFSTGTRDRAKAQARLAGFQFERGDKSLPSPAVSTVLEHYWSAKKGKLASPETARQGINRLLEFFRGNVESLTQRKLDAYYSGGRAVSETTKAREMTVLRAALIFAVKQELLEKAPKVPVTAPAEPLERWLTRSEAARLLWESRSIPHLALFVRLALYTGARSAAILGLQWSQIDLERRRINYNPPGRRQTQKKRPVVRIGPRLSASLQRARKRSEGQWVISYRGKRVLRIIGAFRRAAGRAELEDVTPHTLRHTAATWMALNGLPLSTIAGILGQSIQRTTERYIKHSPDFQHGAAEALERGKVLGRNDD